jgi:hypothetical protein
MNPAATSELRTPPQVNSAAAAKAFLPPQEELKIPTGP